MGLSGHFYSFLFICGPGGRCENLGQVVPWVELPVQRRLYPIFMSGIGLPDIHEYSAG